MEHKDWTGNKNLAGVPCRMHGMNLKRDTKEVQQ